MKRKWKQWLTVSLVTMSSMGVTSCFEFPVSNPGVVALDGDTAIIPVIPENGNLDTEAIFVRGTERTWTQHSKLTLADRENNEIFGFSPVLSGNTAIIGAQQLGSGLGSVYVFTRRSEDSWAQEARLFPSGGETDDFFGWSSALFDDTAVVGAPWDDKRSGAAYVFNRDTSLHWEQRAKLIANDRMQNSEFGSAVALFGNTLVIGAPGNSDLGESSGSAYIFTRTIGGQWKQRAKLRPKDGEDGDFFGSAVAVYDATVVIGAPSSGKKSVSSGSVYVFTRNIRGKWNQQAKLQANDGVSGNEFGRSMAMYGNRVLIGSVSSAYVFVRNARGDWSQQAQLLPKDGISNGDVTKQQESKEEVNSVALSGDTALVSVDDGNFYFFTRDWKGNWSKEAQIVSAH